LLIQNPSFYRTLEQEEMLRWLNKNRDTVLDLYKNQYIAYNEKGVIAHGENLYQ